MSSSPSLEPRAFHQPVVNPASFVLATRDSGYRNLGAALAELIDNSIEAHASTVEVVLRWSAEEPDGHTIAVLDNGDGVPPDQLAHALQFGGTHRFNSRAGMGRFGMGLPNASLSQARRIDLHSWKPSYSISAHLDLDRILTGDEGGIVVCGNSPLPPWLEAYRPSFTTAVVWSRCDRLQAKRLSTAETHAVAELGRIYRHLITGGLTLRMNGSTVTAIDPIRVLPRPDHSSVELLPLIEIPFAVPGSPCRAHVTVQFSLLPLETWTRLPNALKRSFRITKWAGVSVLRENREIAYGWHFMGDKRRENYDDWWRCELRFPAVLDELFGVTHSKQGIRPQRRLLDALVPVISAQAYRLNREVRQRFGQLRDSAHQAEHRADARDNRLPRSGRSARRERVGTTLASNGQRYRLAFEESDSLQFLRAVSRRNTTTVYINRLHPFFTALYTPVVTSRLRGAPVALNAFLLAFGRAISDAPAEIALGLVKHLSDLSAVFLDRQ